MRYPWNARRCHSDGRLVFRGPAPLSGVVGSDGARAMSACNSVTLAGGNNAPVVPSAR
jgi:hypothetical protein